MSAGPATAQGKLREIELLYNLGQMSEQETVAALETLTTIWRGDATEAEGLRLLAHLYTKEARYREAFHVMRVALLAHPNSDLTRKIQDEAASTFESLFLSHKGDTLPPIEALGLFYDYRELTPIGRRGDEMIRRLADRLVAVDLLDQAAKLLQHQVDHRLQGAARAQVATKLAVIYLMDHKPDRALATLQSTRTAQLNNELRDQRLLLQARALSDLGRYNLALQVIQDIKSHQAMRLRADVLWSAHHWRKAAEQIELMYGERWRDFRPLDASERFDILRGGDRLCARRGAAQLAALPREIRGQDEGRPRRPRLRRGERADRHRQCRIPRGRHPRRRSRHARRLPERHAQALSGFERNRDAWRDRQEGGAETVAARHGAAQGCKSRPRRVQQDAGGGAEAESARTLRCPCAGQAGWRQIAGAAEGAGSADRVDSAAVTAGRAQPQCVTGRYRSHPERRQRR